MASYDAALTAAGIGNYNLVSVSSVIPAEATVEAVGEAPDIGATGDRLTVVEASATGTERVSAALTWAEGPEGGLFYEAADAAAPESVRDTAEAGLAAGRALRDWTFETTTTRTVSAVPGDAEHATAVVLAAYGQPTSLL
jgi:arginine decarboxylase